MLEILAHSDTKLEQHIIFPPISVAAAASSPICYALSQAIPVCTLTSGPHKTKIYDRKTGLAVDMMAVELKWLWT